MIPKQDLRIGNSVMYDNRIFQISAITDEFPLLNTPEFGIGVVDWNNIHPIPITEEALVKMGFNEVKKGDYLYWIYARIRINKQFELMIDGNLWIEIKYVHQLCNLFYSLTQTELSYEGESTKS